MAYCKNSISLELTFAQGKHIIVDRMYHDITERLYRNFWMAESLFTGENVDFRG